MSGRTSWFRRKNTVDTRVLASRNGASAGEPTLDMDVTGTTDIVAWKALGRILSRVQCRGFTITAEGHTGYALFHGAADDPHRLPMSGPFQVDPDWTAEEIIADNRPDRLDRRRSRSRVDQGPRILRNCVRIRTPQDSQPYSLKVFSVRSEVSGHGRRGLCSMRSL